jgi:hypothetical protein
MIEGDRESMNINMNSIKKAVAIGMILASMIFNQACNKAQAEGQDSNTTSIAATVNQPGQTGSHECGAPTRAGGKCTRRVANKWGKEEKCWQHGGHRNPPKGQQDE